MSNPSKNTGLRLDDATRARVEALAPYLAARGAGRATFSTAARFLLLDALHRFEAELAATNSTPTSAKVAGLSPDEVAAVRALLSTVTP